ncbi:MAG: roadblock/LC7 domain-containing protein [Desulfuromonas sp.]|nr:roadblock/LC7 domain-containing protein [Desulfuromonas sp.]
MFKSFLQNVIEQTPGARSIVLMGCDGIAVDQVNRAESMVEDTHNIVVEFAAVVKELIHTTTLLSVGDLEEVTVKCENLTIVITMLNAEYFVALLLDTDGHIGKGRYLLKRDAHKLREALD